MPVLYEVLQMACFCNFGVLFVAVLEMRALPSSTIWGWLFGNSHISTGRKLDNTQPAPIAPLAGRQA